MLLFMKRQTCPRTHETLPISVCSHFSSPLRTDVVDELECCAISSRLRQWDGMSAGTKYSSFYFVCNNNNKRHRVELHRSRASGTTLRRKCFFFSRILNQINFNADEREMGERRKKKKKTRISTSLHRIKNFRCARLAGSIAKGNFSLVFFHGWQLVLHFASTNAHYMLKKWHKIDYNKKKSIRIWRDLHLLHIPLGCTNIFHHLFHSLQLMSTRTNEWTMSDIELMDIQIPRLE